MRCFIQTMAAQGSIQYRAYQQLWVVLDYIYPPLCGGCNQPGLRWCADCDQKTRRLKKPLCSICGKPLNVQRLCDRCSQSKPNFRALRSWGVYDGALRKAIHRLKYRKDVALGETLARFLIELLDQCSWQVDMVLPVPLSVARKASRGYNQSALLARPISLARRIPYRPRALKRIRDTQSQVDLSFDQRQINVRDAFKGDQDLVSGKTVLLIDDVATSGATLDACAEAILKAGGKSVYALTLARAI